MMSKFILVAVFSVSLLMSAFAQIHSGRESLQAGYQPAGHETFLFKATGTTKNAGAMKTAKFDCTCTCGITCSNTCLNTCNGCPGSQCDNCGNGCCENAPAPGGAECPAN